jgi:hypothetical protein
MTTSYSNFFGTGWRQDVIDVFVSVINFAAACLIDGLTTTGNYFNNYGGAGAYIRFYFSGDAVVIDEATWYQQNNNSHGTWKWQGSNDGVNWVDIGSAFTLGGSTTQVQTQLNGNATVYKYYQLIMVSGSVNPFCRIYELEFKIDVQADTSYGNSGGAGDRTASLVATSDFGFSGGNAYSFIDGLLNPFWTADAIAGKVLTFDFGTPQIITHGKFIHSQGYTHGTWVWQGSNDGVNWTNIGSSFTLGPDARFYFTNFIGNNTAYQYYRMLGISGNFSACNLYEMCFQIGKGPQYPSTCIIELTAEDIPANVDNSVIELLTEAITLAKPAKSLIDLKASNLARANPANSSLELGSPGPLPYAGLFMVF